MSGRMSLCCCVVTAACCATGCAGGGGYIPSYSPSSTVSSNIASGTRKFAGTAYYEQWDVDIEVYIEARGEAFGFFKSSILRLWGNERFARGTASWLNFNRDGWPDGYDLTAEYIPGYGSTGTVRVTVEVDDFMHHNSGDTVYSCDHLITWE